MVDRSTFEVAVAAAILGNAIGWMAIGRRLVPLYVSSFAFTFHCTVAAWVATGIGAAVARGSAVQRFSALGLVVGSMGIVACGEWFVRSAARSHGPPRGRRPDDMAYGAPQYLSDLAHFERRGSRYRNTRRRRESFSSPTINFVDGWRVTPDDASHTGDATPRVLVFGGSTVVCIEVADAETLPAQLARHLRGHGLCHRVVNRGVMGATLRASWRFVRATPLRRGDVVLVYFGANDVNVAGLFGGPVRGILRCIPGLGGLLRAVGDVVGLRLAYAVGRWLITRDAERLAREAEHRADDVASVVRRIIRHCRTADVCPVVMLQPHALVDGAVGHASTGLPSSVTPKFVDTAVRQYERIRSRCAVEAEFHDLSRVISSDPTKGMYVDWMHLTARGNATVASLIGDHMVRVLRR